MNLTTPLPLPHPIDPCRSTAHSFCLISVSQVAAAKKSGQVVVGEPVASGLSLEEGRLWDSNFTRAAQVGREGEEGRKNIGSIKAAKRQECT